MNLFLYIPQHSAHPVNTTKSLIYSILKTYHRQNPNQADFNSICTLFFNRLKVRGHTSHDFKNHFREALLRLNNNTPRKPNELPCSSHNTIPPSSTTLHSLIQTQTPSHPSHQSLRSTPPHHTTPNLTPSQSPLHPSLNSQQQTPTPIPPQLPSSTPNQLFLHVQYHPKGVSRRQIQQKYHQICESHNDTSPLPTAPSTQQTTPNEGFNNMPNRNTGSIMKIDGLTVAYSRPQNLRDILCPSTLREFGNITASSISQQLKNK